MRRALGIIGMILLLGGVCRSQEADPVVRRLFLVGDAGQPENGHHPVCDWLQRYVDWNDTTNVLVYLGDNISPEGMPPEGGAGADEARKILDYQVSVVAGKRAQAFFIPGNDDWKQGKPGGWEQLKNLEDYIHSLALPNVKLLPSGGCPGPVAVPLGDKIVLVCMDSQWWLQDDNDRPGEQSGCDCKDVKSVIDGLRDIVSTYPDRLIVLAMYHPFYIHGRHGDNYAIRQHILPLTDPRYRDLRDHVEEVIRGHANIVHVAGHEHILQMLQHDSVHYVVSGARQELAAITMHASGRAQIDFFRVDTTRPFFSATLPPLKPRIDTTAIVASFPDSVTAVGDSEFLAGSFKRFLLGANYRKEWSVPIRVKVFDMTGWTPLQRGGGNQTRSLRMENARGVSYVLRGVKKYVTDNALPEVLQGDQFVKDIVMDGVSASYPYAALSIPPLADAMHVPHAHPRLVYVPDDPRLGKFREDYGNLFAFIEEHEPGNGKKTYNMYDIERLVREDNDNTIDQQAVLRARLLDMFVMDFDRHEDQWRWMQVDNGKGKTLSPVPRDRDQPFFVNEGVIPWLAGSAWATPQLQGFRPKARNIRTYNYNAKWFDRNYMNELNEEDWRKGAETALSVLTDSLIGASLRMQPPEIGSYSEDAIIAKLKERKKYYLSEMMTYYRFLSRCVSVYGSDKQELFDVDRHGDSVTVTVYKITREGKVGKTLYRRDFVSGITHEVRLYGLAGNDRFHFHGDGGGGITVRVEGGPGEDSYQNESKTGAGRTRIYDLSTEKNSFSGDGHYRNFLSRDPAVNAVNRFGFKYNVLAPLASVSYNPDDGVFLGAGFRYTTQGFHKEPYKTLQTLTVAHSLSTKAYDFKYSLEAIEAVGRLDLLMGADIKAPDNTVNFFGFGNETAYDKDTKDGIRYYRARYDSYDLDVLLRKRFGKTFSLAFGPAFEYFTVDSADNFDRFINQAKINGLDASTLYLDRAYAGGRASVVIDSRNDKVDPSGGIFWKTEFGSYGGINDASHGYSRMNTDLAVYSSFNSRANVVIANRVGWGRSFGSFQFYEAQFLGATENLRGYRKYRFAGDEAFYHNIDLRIRLANFRTYFFPGSMGLLVFNDVGRVWQHGQQSDQWHDGYGGGIWISPLGKVVFSATYGQGADGGVFLFGLGFQY